MICSSILHNPKPIARDIVHLEGARPRVRVAELDRRVDLGVPAGAARAVGEVRGVACAGGVPGAFVRGPVVAVDVEGGGPGCTAWVGAADAEVDCGCKRGGRDGYEEGGDGVHV